MDQPTVRLLLVERAKSGGYRSTRLYPAAVAILNLFLCAYFERYLKSDVNGFYLSIFLFLETTFYAGVSLVSFFSTSFEILAKSSVFPTTPSGRLMFVIGSNCRRPMVLSLAGSNVFFLIIFFRQTLPLAIAAALLFALLFAITETLLATTLLIVMRRSIPLGVVLVLFGILLFSSFVGSFIFHFESLVALNPLLRWTINGILAAKQADTLGVVTNVAWLLTTSALTVTIGRRFA